jgi:hypothetical protein
MKLVEKAINSLEDEQVIEKGMHALHQALGPAGTRRFIKITRPLRRGSVARHRKWEKRLERLREAP